MCWSTVHLDFQELNPLRFELYGWDLRSGIKRMSPQYSLRSVFSLLVSRKSFDGNLILLLIWSSFFFSLDSIGFLNVIGLHYFSPKTINKNGLYLFMIMSFWHVGLEFGRFSFTNFFFLLLIWSFFPHLIIVIFLMWLDYIIFFKRWQKFMEKY